VSDKISQKSAIQSFCIATIAVSRHFPISCEKSWEKSPARAGAALIKKKIFIRAAPALAVLGRLPQKSSQYAFLISVCIVYV